VRLMFRSVFAKNADVVLISITIATLYMSYSAAVGNCIFLFFRYIRFFNVVVYFSFLKKTFPKGQKVGD